MRSLVSSVGIPNVILSGAPECAEEEILVGDFLFDLHPNRNPHPNHNRFPFAGRLGSRIRSGPFFI
jgi:hypothetical protein